MKTIHRLAVGALLALALPAVTLATDYSVQPTSTLGFSGRFQGARFDGSFTQWDATIRYDPAQLAQAKLDVTVNLASVKVSDADQQRALPGAAFFDVVRYPRAHFVTSSLRKVGNQVIADGQLSLRGVTRPISLTLNFTPQGQHATLDVTGTLKRLDFNVGGGEYADTSVIGADVQVHAHLLLQAK